MLSEVARETRIHVTGAIPLEEDTKNRSLPDIFEPHGGHVVELE
jgi:hypothetical protein